MFLQLFILAAVVASGLLAVGICDCPADLPREALFADDHSCYVFYRNVEREFETAHSFCQAGGGHLVIIRDFATQNFVYLTLKNRFHYTGVVWIGLSDKEKEGQYKWVDGTLAKFTYWASGQPGLAHWTEDCVAMDVGVGGRWYDYECSDVWFVHHRQRFVCEYPMVKHFTTHEHRPETTAPKVTTPESTTPQPTAPEPTTPQPTTPEPTTTEPTTPEPTTPEPTTPEPTTPEPITPEPTTPEPTTPEPTIPEPTTPEPTTPEPTTPEPTTPEPTTPETLPSGDVTASTAVVTSSVDGCWTSLPKYGLKVHDRSCFQFFLHYQREFYTAERECEVRGGHLAIIRDRATQDFLYQVLRHELDYSGAVWIGLSDAKREGQFTWVDGTTPRFTYWAPGQPALFGALKDCVAMEISDGGKWYKYECLDNRLVHNRHSFVCEYPVVNHIPTTTTTPTTPISATTTTTTTPILPPPRPPTTRAPVFTGCPIFECSRDCGLAGYRIDANNCLMCECEP